MNTGGRDPDTDDTDGTDRRGELNTSSKVLAMTADEVYEQVVKPLPVDERLRLVERIAHDLSSSAGSTESATPAAQRYDWMSVRGIAPDVMEGEDAQDW